MRLQFGGGPEDVYMLQDTGTGYIKPTGGAQALFYADQGKLTRYTDLQTMSGATINSVLTETGSNPLYALGQVPPLLGPDGVFEMWCSIAGSPCFLMQASNLGGFLKPIIDQLVQLLNADPMALKLLADVDGASINGAAVGNAVVKLAGGKWGAGTVSGGGGGGVGDVTLTGAQTFTGAKTFDALQTFLKGVLVKPTSTTAVAEIIQGLLNQTGNLSEWRDSTGAVRSWVASDGNLYTANGGMSIPMVKAGALSNGTGTMKWFNDTGTALKFRSLRVSLGTALGTGTAVFDPKVGGTSIYGTPGNRPSVTAGGTTSGKNTGFTAGSVIPDGGYLTVDISGTYTGGADAVLQANVW